MAAPTADDRYTETAARMIPATAVSAVLIIGLVVAEVWGDWRAVGLVAAVYGPLLALNVFATLVLLGRYGIETTETLRTIANLGLTILVAGLTGFPSAIWLWLPFAAITFDHGRPRVPIYMVGSLAIVLDLLALHAHVGWLVPAMFNVLAVVCLLVKRARFAMTRGMLVSSDAQRRELEHAHARLVEEVHAREQIELELRQAQKLEAIGRLAAGIAHEINTPVQFVSDSVHFVDDATRDLLALATRSRDTAQTLRDGASVPDVLAAIAQAELDADLPYVIAHLPGAVARALDGLGRIATIVRSMKEFAHPDLQDLAAADLDRALAATITIAAHECKQVADVDFEPGGLPPVVCRPGELNQVFLNLLVNAAHAIGDVVGDTGTRGRITIRTRVDGGDVVITFADTGAGIPDTIRDRIFDPFFTTKPVGRGTGQGLTIARNVVRQHGGALTFETELGRGTTFSLRLPIVSALDGSSPRSIQAA